MLHPCLSHSTPKTFSIPEDAVCGVWVVWSKNIYIISSGQYDFSILFFLLAAAVSTESKMELIYNVIIRYDIYNIFFIKIDVIFLLYI